MLRIKKPLPILIIEMYDYNTATIKRGSPIYCGHCGKIVGFTDKDLQFPLKMDDFFKSLKECKVSYGTNRSTTHRNGEVIKTFISNYIDCDLCGNSLKVSDRVSGVIFHTRWKYENEFDKLFKEVVSLLEV